MKGDKMLRLTSATRMVAPSGRTSIFGVMNPEDLPNLKVPSYQREALPVTSVEEWQTAFYRGEVPPLDLGSRSLRTTSSSVGITIGGDEIYIIDGLQRVTVAQQLHREGHSLWVPVIVYLDTTEEWEIARFAKLNGSSRKSVSPNVLLRNARLSNRAIAALHGLSEKAGSHLEGRVRWTQTGRSGVLFTAVSLLKVAAVLHSRFGRDMRGSDVSKLAWRVADMVENVGADTFSENVETFFRLIDQSVGGMQQYRSSQGVVQFSLGYMASLALTLASYQEFWQKNRLTIPTSVEKALVAPKIDPLQHREIAARGRIIDYLVKRFTKVAVGARRQQLTPFSG